MRIIHCVPVLMAAAFFGTAPVLAQSTGQGVIEIEGPLEATGVENGNSVIKVMGLTVVVTPDTKLTSPRRRSPMAIWRTGRHCPAGRSLASSAAMPSSRERATSPASMQSRSMSSPPSTT